jgi:hypothetical protein
MKKLVKENLNEIYSDEDINISNKLKDDVFGITINFRGDYKKKMLLIKKLMRFKYQIDDSDIKTLLDEVIHELNKS